MRRHYRNHTTPRTEANENRRRRKQGSSRGLVFVGDEVSPRSSEARGSDVSMSSPISSLSINEDSDDMSDVETGDFQDDEEDQLDSLSGEASPVHNRVERPYSRSRTTSDQMSYDPRSFTARYSQSHMRSGNFSTPDHQSSPLPSPHPHDRIYSPSEPYSRSFADSKVSTALRPAFHAKPDSG
ncbi:hypothetical protein DXG03_004392 [Asterophora parasitica]|uniref:Uncharacterized protein n=1 Tax=Asterophora parasitica TaxID=117018 RepID=A0A9P7G6Q9_9AGAR|nr:hypothetical protein DXG03_004392 [Asterophora parasitica]